MDEKVVEVSPGVYSWVNTKGERVTSTAEDAKKANERPHLGVYIWTRGEDRRSN